MPTATIVRISDELEANFIRLEGQPVRGGMELQPFTRPGVDGIGFVQEGKHGRPFRLIGFRDFETMTAASEGLAALRENLMGQLVTVYDSSGVAFEDIVVLAVIPREPIPILRGVGGLVVNPGAIATVEFEMVHRKWTVIAP